MEFVKEIEKVTSEIIEEGTVERILKDKISKGIEKAIDDSFRWGELHRAIENKVKEVMIPIVENYDLDIYNAKLELCLEEIIKQSFVTDTKKILENFKTIIKDTDATEIDIKEIFEEYKDYVSARIDTFGREVDTDDEPTYVNAPVILEIEEVKEHYAYRKKFLVKMQVDEEGQEEMEVRFFLRESYFKDGEFEVETEGYDIFSLRYMRSVDAFLLKLEKERIIVSCDVTDCLEDEVEIDERPEADFI